MLTTLLALLAALPLQSAPTPPALAQPSTSLLPAGSTIVALAQGDRSATLIDGATLETRARFEFDVVPHEVIASACGTRAYVMLYGDGAHVGTEIAELDLEQDRLVGRHSIAPFERPHGVVEHRGALWFTAETARAVARFDPLTGRVDRVVGHGGAGGHMVALDPGHERGFVANVASASLSILDLGEAASGPTGIQSVAVPAAPEGLAVSPDGREVWLGHKVGGLVSIVDVDTAEQVATIEAGAFPFRIAFDCTGSRVYWTEPERGLLVEADAASREVLRQLQVGNGPTGFALHAAQDGGGVAVVSLAGEGRAALVDLTTGTVRHKLPSGPSADGICIAARREPVAPADPDAVGWLGIQGTNGQPAGVLVSRVAPDSPADRAGLRAGDRLLTLNACEVLDIDTLLRQLQGHCIGERVRFGLLRDGQEQSLTVVLGRRPLLQ
ncbi:MAG: PDZ domain-containing protein [Planctomycetota bacterium]